MPLHTIGTVALMLECWIELNPKIQGWSTQPFDSIPLMTCPCLWPGLAFVIVKYYLQISHLSVKDKTVIHSATPQLAIAFLFLFFWYQSQ